MTMTDSLTHRPNSLPDADLKPWYRYTWPWVLMTIPFAAVLFGILMIYMVTRYPDDLMVDNYYKEGMAINQSLAMDTQAHDLGVEAVLLQSDPGQIRFSINGVTDSVVVLELFHVTDRDLDRVLVLYPEPEPEPEIEVTGSNTMTYSAPDEDLAQLLRTPGIWYIQLSGADDQWRLRQRIQTPVQQLALHSQ